jgi:hypothetical protein
MKWAIIPAFLILLGLPGCHKDPVSLRPLDLHQYNIPMIILAPDSAVVLEKDYKFMRDITIRKAPDFDIQLFELTSTAGDAAGEKFQQLASVQKDPYFKEVVRVDDYGFIFSKHLDSLTVDYDFRLIKLFGEKELIFQTGLSGSYTLDQVERMYKAVK